MHVLFCLVTFGGLFARESVYPISLVGLLGRFFCASLALLALSAWPFMGVNDAQMRPWRIGACIC